MNDWSRQTVLVAEDSALQRAHLVGLARLLGFGQVLEAANGLEAFKLLEQHGDAPIHLLITDLDMPVMDGMELTRRLAGHHYVRHVIVTTACDPRLLEAVEAMAAEDPALCLLGTLVKPVLLDDLVLMLARATAPRAGGAQAAEHPAFNRGALAGALRQGQFIPYYQPRVAIMSGLVKGVEALARWRHPEHGVLAPLHFLPLVQEGGLLKPFTAGMVDMVLRHSAGWRRYGLSLNVSLNLPAECLGERAFADDICELVRNHGLAPESITWELPESALMDNLSACLPNLTRLRLQGFGLALDNYGIGCSSIQHMSRCPFTDLKIDRIFVHDAADLPARRQVLESAIEIGHRLAAAPVAVGVETLPDWQLLRELSCDMAQGCLIAMPMPVEELPGWIKTNRVRLKSLAAAAAAPAAPGGNAITQ
jgi:EAL domain-containing protein (putative c-di-GMP-specific phosphodiesterase class I)/CheY-like chemotaxis protein